MSIAPVPYMNSNKHYRSRTQELKELRLFKQRVENIAYGFCFGVFSCLMAYAIFMFITGA